MQLFEIILLCHFPSPPLNNIRVMVIVWWLRRNVIRTALCWIVWHSVHSLQHTYMSSSYRSNGLGLSHWYPYAVHKGGCLELYYFNMVEWFWWDTSLILTTNWFPSVLWHCWFGHLACKIVPEMTYYVMSGTLSLYTTTAVPFSVIFGTFPSLQRSSRNRPNSLAYLLVIESCFQ